MAMVVKNFILNSVLLVKLQAYKDFRIDDSYDAVCTVFLSRLSKDYLLLQLNLSVPNQLLLTNSYLKYWQSYRLFSLYYTNG